MGISVPELEKMMTDANAVNLISLNKKWYETDSYKDVREIDILEDKKGEDPTRRIQKNDLMRLVTKGLNRNERLIIILYYYEELTMKEIGATLDLSESRVSQMHSLCPECRSPRQARCPICGAVGTKFPLAAIEERQGRRRVLLICDSCDDHFRPEFFRVCHQCGHDYQNGISVEAPSEPVDDSWRAWIALAIVVFIGLLLAAYLYYVVR
jgi:hypothetical protein